MEADIVKTFDYLGRTASYHYADDSGSEWNLGDIAKDAAIVLFKNNPELQPEMREVAKGFLWSLPGSV